VEASGEVFGDATNTAARVQSAAGPGSILITATVQRQTAGLFVAEDCRQHELKGVSTPMTLYRVGRANGDGRRKRRSATRANLAHGLDRRRSAPGVMFRKMKPWTGRCMRGSSPSYRARTI
jgi:class 3 adenylate cyclase